MASKSKKLLRNILSLIKLDNKRITTGFIIKNKAMIGK